MHDQPRAIGGPGRVMLVDDDLQLTAGLKDALERQGYAVLVINHGAKAVEAAERFRPGLLLLDVMMPGIDGWEVLKRVRAHPATTSIPVIMLTASDSEEAKVRGFTLGADDYVTKPFGLQELRCRIAAVLRRSATVEAAHDDDQSIPVVSERPGFDLVRSSDVYYIEGIRNYTYVHTADVRILCRLTLHELDDRRMPGFMRVQRSFIVNLDRVCGCGWVNKSSYQLRLADRAGTSVPVSRTLVTEVQRHLGLRA